MPKKKQELSEDINLHSVYNESKGAQWGKLWKRRVFLVRLEIYFKARAPRSRSRVAFFPLSVKAKWPGEAIYTLFIYWVLVQTSKDFKPVVAEKANRQVNKIRQSNPRNMKEGVLMLLNTIFDTKEDSVRKEMMYYRIRFTEKMERFEISPGES